MTNPLAISNLPNIKSKAVRRGLLLLHVLPALVFYQYNAVLRCFSDLRGAWNIEFHNNGDTNV